MPMPVPIAVPGVLANSVSICVTSSVSPGVCGSVYRSVCSQLWPIPASVTNDNVAAAASVVMLPYSLFFYSFFYFFFPTVAYPADIYAASKLCREGRAGQGRGEEVYRGSGSAC